MGNVVDQESSEKSINTYDQFVGSMVCLPDERWRKIMARVTNHVKDKEGTPIGIGHPALFADHSLYAQLPNVRADSERDL